MRNNQQSLVILTAAVAASVFLAAQVSRADEQANVYALIAKQTRKNLAPANQTRARQAMATLTLAPKKNSRDTQVASKVRGVIGSAQRRDAQVASKVRGVIGSAQRRDAQVASKVRGVIGSAQRRDVARTKRILEALYGAKPKASSASGVQTLAKPAETTVMPPAGPKAQAVKVMPLDTPSKKKTPILLNPNNSRQKKSSKKKLEEEIEKVITLV